MDKKKAELVTKICKYCQEHRLTQQDLDEIMAAVDEFYQQNARP